VIGRRTCGVMKLVFKKITENRPYYVMLQKIMQTNLLPKCWKYPNDHKILDRFPFPVELNPASPFLSRTYALKNAHGNVYYVNIANEKRVPCLIFCLKHLSKLIVQATPFHDFNFQLPMQIKHLAGSLKHLEIRDTPITHLPEEIGELINLQSLKLSNTNLTVLPNAIGKLSSLTQLHLSKNKLTSLPPTMINLRLLNHITLTNNPNFRSVQPLNGLPHLEILQTDSSPIENLPRNLPQLVYLYMSDNNLTNLVNIETLGNGTTKEKSFYFNMNHITSIPYEIQFVKNLVRLNLDDNKLETLPKSIFIINTLQHLYIKNNSVSINELKMIVAIFNSTNPKLNLVY
jgi:Leucine-rich repeat (LRR) protein